MPSKALLITLALAMAGVAVFRLLGLPLPFLFGPMAACLIAALAGMKLKASGPVSAGSRTILGVAVGAAITPELVGQVPVMATTLMLMPIYIALIGLIGVPFFHRLCGMDRATAYYAAMPGGLQDMVVFGAEAGANVRTLSLVHATRVLIIIAVVPIIMSQTMGMTLDRPIGEPASSVPVHELFIMAAAALVGWKGGERIGLFGATIIGPLIVTAVLALTDVIHHRPPAEALNFAQFFIGMAIGVNYVGVTLRELRHDVLSGAAFALVLAVLAAIFTALALWLSGAPAVEAFLSFAPGGQAEMAILAIVAGADLGFVVVHHIMRIVLVIVGAPLVGGRVLKKGKPK